MPIDGDSDGGNRQIVILDREPVDWRAVAGAVLQLSTFVVAFILLRVAADFDRHFYLDDRREGRPIREGAGLFLLAGLASTVPALVALGLRAPRWRTVVAAAVVMLVAVICELAVTAAPQPWFVFSTGWGHD